MGNKLACRTDFIVVRASRLSLNKIKQFPKTESAIQSYLEDWISSYGVMEAIYLASPSLFDRLELWRNKPGSKSSRKVTTALLKYLIRMSCRPTPFGLFSGVSLGRVAEITELVPANLQLDCRKTRLDMFYLSTIKEQWARSEEGRLQLRFVPNSTLYRLGSYLHYIESYQSSDQRQYRLSSVELDEALEAILRLVEGGMLEVELAELFCKDYPETSLVDAQSYIQQLIQEQVLIPELKLPLTCGKSDQTLVRNLLRSNNQRDGQLLQEVLSRLADLDQQQSADPNDYKNIVQQLRQLPYPVSENKLFQTDSWRAMPKSQLDRKLIAVLEKIILSLKAHSIRSANPFRDFITTFQRRFEGQFVPLLHLLDAESGIPFSSETGYETPLLAGINIVDRQRSSAGQTKSALDQNILKALHEQKRMEPINLDSDELLKNADVSSLWQELPSAFAVNVSCYLDQEGQPLLHVHGWSGPSGANMIGRFCHLDNELLSQVRNYLAAEEALSPEAVFAEVVHMPDGRPGNVIARPQLRQYEIVFLADSITPEEQQIPVQDLHVFVEAGQVKLWSKRLNKQVIPRLTSAHNYSSRSLGVYRFLCTLQHQQSRLPGFGTPAGFTQLHYQPRIQVDGVILREAHWQVERSMLEALVVNDEWQSEAWSLLRQQHQLTRYVCYAIRDNVLTIDLHNPKMVSMLLGETIRQKRVQLKESLAMQYKSMVSNESGNFAHEIIIPMLNRFAKPFESSHINPLMQTNVSIQRCYSPGSEWLSLKIYAAQSTAELILSDMITPMLYQWQQQGLVRQWFFIRYGDPDWHLRIRLFGVPEVLYGTVLPSLQKQLKTWVESGRVHKTEIFTYQREVERYGGSAAMLMAEQVFQADSSLVLETLLLIRKYGESVRWRMALLAVDAMLTAFDYNVTQKLDLVNGLRRRFGVEFQEHAELRIQLGKKYRDYSTQLHQDFNALNSGAAEEPLQRMLAIRLRFLQQLKPIAAEILLLQKKGQISCTLNNLMDSLLHMLNNRMFKAYGREQEFVVYDFLRRFYLSLHSQQKQNNHET